MTALREQLSRLAPSQVATFLAGLTPAELSALKYDWAGCWARAEQLAPEDGDWTTFLYLAGRSAGKTRSAAEWVRSMAQKHAGCRIAIVARTAADCRDTCVEGESGVLSVCPPGERPLYEPSKRRVTWRNGSQATCYSADEPDLLRGPQHHFAWCDELATWQRLDETWANLRLGLRLGKHPRCMVTTTPRPLPLLRELLKSRTTVVRKGSTFDNAANLAPSALAEFRARYEGTRLGRQELYAEILDDIVGALWSREVLDSSRVKEAPRDLVRVVAAIDPAVSSGEGSDETGIIVAGRSDAGHFYVLADLSCRLSPDGWARRAVTAFDTWQADRIVAEANQGGEMVESVIRTVNPNVPVIRVHASRGKRVRAEPIAALYEQGKVHHCGSFPELEDQMCSFAPETAADSPDRLDAAVWALSELSGRGGAVLHYERTKNELVPLPLSEEARQTVIGCRLAPDGDAIAVLTWQRTSAAVHLIDEWSGGKQSMSELAKRLKEAIEKHKPLAVVVDAGEAGQPVVYELCSRYGLPLEVAEPKEFRASIELLNDAMRSGRFFAKSDGPFGIGVQRVEWDRSNGAKSEIVGATAIVDAVVTAYLRCLAWLHKPAEVLPQPGTPEHAQWINKKLFERAQREVAGKKNREYSLGDFGLNLDGDNFGVDDDSGFGGGSGWPSGGRGWPGGDDF
jgi:phage terminase large subunit-like protein